MWQLTILGNNSALPAYGRNPSAQVLQADGEVFLIDCGEGSQMQMEKFKVKAGKIKHIFISHLHGDHYFGLVGLLTSYGLLKRTEPLTVYSPAGLEQIIAAHFTTIHNQLSYPLTFKVISEAQTIFESNTITVSAFPVIHSIETYGFLFQQKTPLRKLNIEQLNNLQVPVTAYKLLQQGNDYVGADGRKIKNDELTFAGKEPLSYAYCADTVYDEQIAVYTKNVHTLYHETTYLEHDAELAKCRAHSTTVQAGAIAKLAEAQQLIIGHFSSRYKHIEPFEIETKTVFESTMLAEQGKTFEIQHHINSTTPHVVPQSSL